MKKNKNSEMMIYELLGVKIFRKMIFGLRDIISYPLTIGMNKEKKHDFLYNKPTNYNIGMINSLEDIKKFKKQLYMNASIHICGLLLCMPNLFIMICGVISLRIAIINLIFIFINLYCIMLQRYNCIRINQIINKMMPRYEKQKDIIKDEIRKSNSNLYEYTYKIFDREQESTITLEELL